MSRETGKLYIVATPIGNLGDITLRAIETLRSVDVVVCEDTRVSGKLLKYLGISKPLLSLHQHSLDSDIAKIADRLKNGDNIAYITDGGTPGISDPGQRLVQRTRQISNDKFQMSNKCQNPNIKTNNLTIKQFNNIEVIPIPGPSAVAAAISVSGMVEKEFYFAGFLPKKKGRQTKFKELSSLDCPIVIYESALRLERTLNDIKSFWGEDKEVFIAREMTKMFEEYWGGPVTETINDLKNHKLKGEIVLLVK